MLQVLTAKVPPATCLQQFFKPADIKQACILLPHLKDFRERIKINGEMLNEKFVVDFTEKIKPHIEKIEPSFFEITVAMAFDYFAQQQVDIAVVEVGLGGRFDSTNIIQPELSVITNIGWDHMNMLGNSLAEIAFEKAGIIKHNTPAIVGETTSETRPVFEKKAKDENASLFFADHERYTTDWKYTHHSLTVEIANSSSDGERETYTLDLPGFYQTKNLLTVLEVIHQLNKKGWNLQDKEVKKALQKVKKLTGLHGRWEVIRQNPAVILDVGHNEDGIKQVAAQIELTSHRQLHIVFGMVKDKEAEKILSLLPPEAFFYFTKADIQRALDENVLTEIAKSLGLSGQSYPNVNDALHAALHNAQKDDLIVVCGSVFVVGELDAAIVNRQS